jgi:hypothetical protein
MYLCLSLSLSLSHTFTTHTCFQRRVTLIADWLPEGFDPKPYLPPISANKNGSMSLAVDARQYGNVARFIRKADVSKGEAPNLYMQVIYYLIIFMSVFALARSF